jgi:hypothetical protein
MVVLDEMGEKGKPALDEVRKIVASKPEYMFLLRVAQHFVEKLGG